MLKKNLFSGVVSFSIVGEVNLTDIADFLREMTGEIVMGRKAFMLDISNAEHIHRHAFDSLINIKNRLKANGVRLVIVCSKQALIDILNVERVPEHFEVLRDSSSLKQNLANAFSVQSYRN